MEPVEQISGRVPEMAINGPYVLGLILFVTLVSVYIVKGFRK